MLHPTSVILGNVSLATGVMVEPFCFLGRPVEAVVRSQWEAGNDDFDTVFGQGLPTRFGERVTIRSGCVVYEDVVLAPFSELGHHAVVREGVRVDAFARVWPHTSIRRGARIGQGARVGGVVGDRAAIGPYATSLGSLVHDYRTAVGGQIEDAPRLGIGSVVGRGAVVVGGVTIGDYAFVSAGAVVSRDVPAMAVVAGNPARVVGERDSQEIARVQARMAEGKYL